MASTFFDFAKRGRPLTFGALLSIVGCAGGQDVSETFDSLSDTATETNGDGDGDPTTGDGDPTGDGDGDPGCTQAGCECDGAPDSCDPGLACVDGMCASVTCGNGITESPAEECDDGNDSEGDGCDNDCSYTKFLSIAAGANHTCARIEGGKVRCWGLNSVGQLGYGNTDNIGDNEPASTPGQVVIGGDADYIHAGTNHTCAILSDETARCWGAGGTGQLGLGNTENVGDDEFPFNVNTLTINADILDIQAGSGHTCALVGAGSVRCWGRNDFGQLGYGNMTDLAIPLTVDLSLGGTVTQLAVGAHHNCALFDDNSVRCWGYNNTGQLGYGSTDNIGDNETPGSVPVVPILPQGIPDDAQINQVALGVEHSCVLYDTGDVICWGANFYGQLGQGTTTTVGDNETLATLQKMELGGDAVSLVLGKHHTCALMSDNGVKCWGRNIYGQLGRGDIANIGDDETPATIDNIDLGGEVTWLTAGDYHTCAIIEEHEILCWGFNDYGQLGYGDTEYRGDDETPAEAGGIDLL